LAIPFIKEKVGKLPKKNKKIKNSDNGDSTDVLQGEQVETAGGENADVSEQISQNSATNTANDGDKAVGEA
jgi:hypothetical protein